MLRSGDCIKLAPGKDNADDFISLHKLHPSLWRYRHFGLIETTFKEAEEIAIGGDRRAYKVGLGQGSIKIPFICREALDAILDHIDFTDLDCEVTIRHWNGLAYANYSGVLRYIRDEKTKSDPANVFDVEFDYFDMDEL